MYSISLYQDNAWNKTRSIRIVFFSALGLTLLAIAVGLIAGYFLKRNFGAPSIRVTSALQIGGAAIILAATLAKVGLNQFSLLLELHNLIIVYNPTLAKVVA